MKHGNLTSNQVILYQEIQFPGMDVVFFPYTLPVYPHPASQRFPFLIHSPLPRQRPPCPFWRSASLKSLSQPSVTDVPGHPTSTPMVHTYTRPLVIGEVKGSLIFELHHVHRGTKNNLWHQGWRNWLAVGQKRRGFTIFHFLVPQIYAFRMLQCYSTRSLLMPLFP